MDYEGGASSKTVIRVKSKDGYYAAYPNLPLMIAPTIDDGLVLHGWDGAERVTAFISRHVMDNWVDSPILGGAVSFETNTTHSANAIFQQSSELSHRSISVVRRLAANTHSWMFCYRIL
jgi:hypothetical protein